MGKGLSRELVLRAAVALVDERGLEALSMRALGRRLGVEAMSLYRHVENKADLLDGIHATILTEMRVPEPRGDWREQLRALCHAFRAVLAAHPRALLLFATRPAVTPTALDHVEAVIGVLEAAGFGPAARVHALQTLVAFVTGSALLQFGLDPAEEPEIAYEALPPERYPHVLRVAPALADHDPEEEFAFGLEAVLAGLATPAPGPPPPAA